MVVKVDASNEEILAIGGNVRGTVSLKRLPATEDPGGPLRPSRATFAHLKLRAEPIALEALENSPTIKSLSCDSGFAAPSQVTAITSSRTQNDC